MTKTKQKINKKKIEYYIVKLERPPGVSGRDMLYYLQDAINTWNGQYEPWNGQYEPSKDPLFGFRCKSVKAIK